MNVRIEALQLNVATAIAAIDPMTKHWLQRLHALHQPTGITEVSDDALQELLSVIPYGTVRRFQP